MNHLYPACLFPPRSKTPPPTYLDQAAWLLSLLATDFQKPWLSKEIKLGVSLPPRKGVFQRKRHRELRHRLKVIISPQVCFVELKSYFSIKNQPKPISLLHGRATSTILETAPAARSKRLDFSAHDSGFLSNFPLIKLTSPRKTTSDLRAGPMLSICCITSI